MIIAHTNSHTSAHARTHWTMIIANTKIKSWHQRETDTHRKTVQRLQGYVSFYLVHSCACTIRSPVVSICFVSFCRLSGFHAYCVCSVLSVRICLWIWYMCYCCCGRSSASPTDIAAFSSQFGYKCAFMCIWFSRILTVTSCGCTNSFFHKNFKSNWNLLFFHFKTFFPSVYFQLVRGFVFDSQIHEKTTIFLYI